MTPPAAASLEVELALVRRVLGAREDEPTGVAAARVVRERDAQVADLRPMTDQELAEHTLALHGQLERVSRERARRWQAAEAERAARGVAWCEDGEHEVPIADIIRGEGDYDDVCKACGEANRRQFDAATFAHTDGCPGGTVRTGRGVKVVCDWTGKGTDVIADPHDGPTCPRCDRALEELRDDVTRDAELRARGADPAKVRELAAEMDAATFDRDVLGVAVHSSPARARATVVPQPAVPRCAGVTDVAFAPPGAEQIAIAEQLAANLTAATGVPHRVWQPSPHRVEEREMVRASREDAAARIAKHTRDEDCTLDDDGTCTGCGVAHAHEGCEACGGRGFHRPGCPEGEGDDTVDLTAIPTVSEPGELGGEG